MGVRNIFQDVANVSRRTDRDRLTAIELRVSLKMLPPMPPELIEAKGEYQVIYPPPLSKAMRAQQAAGFMRAVESAINLVSATQDTSIMDVFVLIRRSLPLAGMMSTQAKMIAAQAKNPNAVNQPGAGGGALSPQPQGVPRFGPNP